MGETSACGVAKMSLHDHANVDGQKGRCEELAWGDEQEGREWRVVNVLEGTNSCGIWAVTQEGDRCGGSRWRACVASRRQVCVHGVEWMPADVGHRRGRMHELEGTIVRAWA